MAFLQQNMNQFAPAAILGGVDLVPSPSVIPVMIDPASTAAYIQNSSALKLKGGVSAGIPIVDVATGPTDAAQVFGVVPYTQRKNKWAKGDVVDLIVRGVVWFRTSAAVTRGTKVAMTGATATTDPLVATDVTTGHQILGIALDEATAADQLIRVELAPSTNP